MGDGGSGSYCNGDGQGKVDLRKVDEGIVDPGW